MSREGDGPSLQAVDDLCMAFQVPLDKLPIITHPYPALSFDALQSWNLQSGTATLKSGNENCLPGGSRIKRRISTDETLLDDGEKRGKNACAFKEKKSEDMFDHSKVDPTGVNCRDKGMDMGCVTNASRSYSLPESRVGQILENGSIDSHSMSCSSDDGYLKKSVQNDSQSCEHMVVLNPIGYNPLTKCLVLKACPANVLNQSLCENDESKDRTSVVNFSSSKPDFVSELLPSRDQTIASAQDQNMAVSEGEKDRDSSLIISNVRTLCSEENRNTPKSSTPLKVSYL